MNTKAKFTDKSFLSFLLPAHIDAHPVTQCVHIHMNKQSLTKNSGSIYIQTVSMGAFMLLMFEHFNVEGSKT